MIVSIYLEEHEYLIDKPQTLNFGGKYLYSFNKIGKDLIVQRKLNEKYISDFFDVSDSTCSIELLSAVVGQNGVGKSSILDVIRSLFVEHIYSIPHNICTVLAEINGETKVLYSNVKTFIVVDNEKDNISIQRDFIINKTLNDEQLPEGYNELENVNIEDFQTIYYSPHFDLKYNNNFSDVDQYDISLDQYIKEDLENSDKKGTNENGWRFGLHEELIFKNSIRQVEFLNSEIFKNNLVFRDVFELPEYETGIIHFREVQMPDFWNTPNPLRPIIEVILEKAEGLAYFSRRKF